MKSGHTWNRTLSNEEILKLYHAGECECEDLPFPCDCEKNEYKPKSKCCHAPFTEITVERSGEKLHQCSKCLKGCDVVNVRTMQLKVSMDGLRQNLARDYASLIRYLNENIDDIDKNQLEEILLELRQDIGFLHCVYSAEEEMFSDLSEETKNIPEITFNKES